MTAQFLLFQSAFPELASWLLAGSWLAVAIALCVIASMVSTRTQRRALQVSAVMVALMVIHPNVGFWRVMDAIFGGG